MRNTKNIVFWKDTKTTFIHKFIHISKASHNGNAKKIKSGFACDTGDVPYKNFNGITKVFEDVVNTRGFGYAHRKAKRYR